MKSQRKNYLSQICQFLWFHIKKSKHDLYQIISHTQGNLSEFLTHLVTIKEFQWLLSSLEWFSASVVHDGYQSNSGGNGPAFQGVAEKEDRKYSQNYLSCGDWLKEGEGTSQRTYTKDSWTWTMVWGLTMEVEVGWVEGGKVGKTGTTVVA